MTTRARYRTTLAVMLVAILVGGTGLLVWTGGDGHRGTHITAYFDNSNGLYPGDEVRILGVPVGEVATIEPQPASAKVTFWVSQSHQVPADAKAVIISPSLVTARAIELTPAYTGGPVLGEGAIISRDRTAVPVEWDDLREQLDVLAKTLQPSGPGMPSTLGSLIDTAAMNIDGQGLNIRDAITHMSEVFSALGDHSGDIFSTVKNLATLVTALHSNTQLMTQLNRNLDAITADLANDPGEIARVIADLHVAAGDVRSFVADNSEAATIATQHLSSISQVLVDSIDDIKQTLHVAPNTFQNYNNIYQPAQAAQTGVLALNNFANPITFVCGAIQAASRLGAEQSAKLCMQYLAPIVKNRQYNFPPIGFNLAVGTQARPNEVTYSEDWLRPGYQPVNAPPLPGDDTATTTSDPSMGLPGVMMPPEGR